MAEPKLRFKSDNGSCYPKAKRKTVGEVFLFVTEKNKDKSVDNVITNSAEFGLVPQRDFFDKDIASKDNTDGYTVIRTGYFVYNPRKSATAPYGPFNCYRLKDPGIVSPLYTCLRPKTAEVSVDYLEWYFASSAWHRYIYNNGAQGGARHDRVGMTNDLMKGIPVVIPSVEEQDKISCFLDVVTELIATITEEVRLWEEKKKGVMQKIFSQEVRFKDENGEDYPEWEEVLLSSYFPLIRNGFVGTVTDFFSDKTTGVRYIEGTNIHDGVISDNVEVYVTKDFHHKYIRNELKADDILMVQSGHVGECAVVGEKYKGANCHALIIMSSNGACNPQYVVYYFYSPEGKNKIDLIKTGNTVKHILASEMNKFMISLPCKKEQDKIVECLSAVDDVITIKKQKLETWKTIKKGLLQQMFV